MSSSAVVVLRSMQGLSRVVLVVPGGQYGGWFVFVEKQYEPCNVDLFAVYWYWDHPSRSCRRRHLGRLDHWAYRRELLPRFEFQKRADFDLATGRFVGGYAGLPGVCEVYAIQLLRDGPDHDLYGGRGVRVTGLQIGEDGMWCGCRTTSTGCLEHWTDAVYDLRRRDSFSDFWKFVGGGQ